MHQKDAAHPSDAQAAAIGRAVLALVDAIGLRTATTATYDATNLPAGISRDAFLRRHAQRVREGAAGWTRVGQARVVTTAAWAADVERETARARRRATAIPPVAANDAVDELDVALGIRTRCSR